MLGSFGYLSGQKNIYEISMLYNLLFSDNWKIFFTHKCTFCRRGDAAFLPRHFHRVLEALRDKCMKASNTENSRIRFF